MSFSKQIKEEVLKKQNIQNDCCMLAFLNGLITSAGYYDVANKHSLLIQTDVEDLSAFLETICQKLYGEGISVQKHNSYQIKKQPYYTISFNENLSDRVLKDSNCLVLENGEYKKNSTSFDYTTMEDHCLKSFVSGVFVGCGTSSISINNNHRQTTGYHLEFTSKDYDFLHSISHILAQFDVVARLTQRRKMFVLYVKDANEVSNVLALVSAYNSVFDLQNEMAVREVRNKVNRQTNCTNANINKTINASFKQNDAIATILIKAGLDFLPQDLQNVALLRMANPDESLDELVGLAKFDITKSGLNYRLNKLIKIAQSL